MSKYKLGPKEANGLHRITALVAIASQGVSIGDVGGYIQSENNLDQHGNASV